MREEIEGDWTELKRLAVDSAYANSQEVKELVHEQTEAPGIRSPSSSSDRHLHELYKGERGLPFKKTEEF